MKNKPLLLLNALALAGGFLASCGFASPISDIIVVYQDVSEAKIDQLKVGVAGVYANQSYSSAAKGYRSRIVFRFANASKEELRFTVKDMSCARAGDASIYKVDGFPSSDKLGGSASTLIVSSAVTPTPLSEGRYFLSVTINSTKYIVHLYDKPDSERKDYAVKYEIRGAVVHTVTVKENRPIGVDYIYESPSRLSHCNVWIDTQRRPIGSGTKVLGDLTAFGEEKDNILFADKNGSALECAATSLDYIPRDRIVVVPKEHNGTTVSEISDSFFFSKPVKEIYLPNSIKAIGARNFSYCTLLQTIHFEGTEEDWKAIDNASKENIPEGVAIRYESVLNG